SEAVSRYHVWADDPRAPAHVHTRPDLSIWDSATASRGHLERLFTSEDPGLFAVVQSSSGLAPSEIAAAAAENHFPGRRGGTGGPIRQAPPAKLRERLLVATRVVAQVIYRMRRALGGRKHRPPHSAGAAQVATGVDRVASQAGRR